MGAGVQPTRRFPLKLWMMRLPDVLAVSPERGNLMVSGVV